MSQLATPIADAVTARLQTLQPSVYQLENESMRHAGYFEGKETHFKLTIVSEAFAGKRLLQRHQLEYGLIHALLNKAVGKFTRFQFMLIHKQNGKRLGNLPKVPIAQDKTQGNMIKKSVNIS